MTSFPTTVNPSYGASKNSAPKIKEAIFGSGYSQRTTFGINQNLKVWNFQWNNITETECDEMEAFLDARGGTENFDYTAPGESASSKYICREWSKSIPYAQRVSLVASFEEVAET